MATVPELAVAQASISLVRWGCVLPDQDRTRHSNPRPRILLVDDYPSLLTALKRLLSLSYTVVGTLRTGAQAVEAAACLQPDVVVVDVRLPDIDGLKVCGLVKAVAPNARVIVFTASEAPGVRQTALAAGASTLVLKHRAGDDLLAAIAEALGQGCTVGNKSLP